MRAYIIFLITLLSSACSKDVENIITKEQILDDKMLFIMFDKGREIDRKFVTLDPQSKEILRPWIESFAELSKKDYRSYAPRAILLGSKIKVNFQREVTVISVKPREGSEEVWRQFSRHPTPKDMEIKSFLENKMPDLGK